MGKRENGSYAQSACGGLRNNNQSLPPKMINYKVCRQLNGYCGPASLKIVFDYHGIVKTQKEWAKLSGHTLEDGVQNEGMIKAIKSVGYSYKIIKEASFDDLRNLVAQNKTAIVIWWSSGSFGSHYSPVVDVSDKSITIADPEFGRYRRISLKRFDHRWFDFAEDYNRKPQDLELKNILVIYKPKRKVVSCQESPAPKSA